MKIGKFLKLGLFIYGMSKLPKLFEIIEKAQLDYIKILEEKINYLKETYLLIKYKILSKENGFITIGVRYYDLDGNEVAYKKYKANGDVPSFDITIVPITDIKHFAFPALFFTNKIAPKKGRVLYQDYEKDGFPMIYHSKDNDKSFVKAIKILYNKVKNGKIKIAWGTMVEPVPVQAKVGTIWKIVYHPKGGVELLKEL